MPGRRGPHPTPTHLKLLRGNPGKQAIHDEPQPALADQPPPAPHYLSGYAREDWDRVATELYRLKLLSVVDIPSLAAYCDAYERWRQAKEALQKMAERDPAMSALMIKTRNGNAMQNPLAITADKAAAAMVRYAAEFGLTPAAR